MYIRVKYKNQFLAFMDRRTTHIEFHYVYSAYGVYIRLPSLDPG